MEDRNSFFFHLRRLPKKGKILKELRNIIHGAFSPLGKVMNITILHGRGQALVELENPDIEQCMKLVTGTVSIEIKDWEKVPIISNGKSRIYPDVESSNCETVSRFRGWNNDDPVIIKTMTATL